MQQITCNPLNGLKQLEDDEQGDFDDFLSNEIYDFDDEEELTAGLPKLAVKVKNKIEQSKKTAEKLADQHSEEIHRSDNWRGLIILGASFNLLRIIASRIVVAPDDQKYQTKVKKALNDSQALKERFVTTEVFDAYNEKIMANNKYLKGFYIWNAELDARTCAVCEDLDGKTFKNEDDVPDFHINCRCFLEFEMEQK